MAKAKKKTIAANRNNSLKDALEKARERVQNKTESAAGGESRSTSSNTQKNTGTTTKEWLKNYSDRVNNTANTARKNIASSANRSSTFESRAAGVRDYGRNRTNNLSGAPSAEARRYTDYINRANKNGYGTGRLQKTSMSRRQQGQQDYELRKQDAEKTKAAQRREEISYLNSRKEEAAQIKRSERDERVAKRKAELTARANQHLDEMYHRAPGTSAQMQYEQELKDYNKQTRQQQIDLYNQQHLIRADAQTDIDKGTAKPTQDFSKMSLEDLLVSMYQSNDQMTQAKRLFDRQKYNTNRNIDEARREIDAEYAQYNADYMAALAEYQRRTGNFTSEQKRKLSESILKQYSGDNAVPNTYESFFGDNSERKRQEALRWANENVLASDTYYSTRQDMWNTLSEDEQNLLQSYVRDTQMNPYGAGVEMLADNYDDKKIDKIYGKLKNLGYDKDDVDEYVQRMNYAALSEEREQRIQENLAENPVLAGMGYSAESVLTNLASGVDNIQMLKSIRSGKAAERTGDILQYRPVDTNQMMLTKSTQQMRQYTGDIIENRFGGVARFAYDAAMSSADSALSTAIGTLVGGEYVAGQLVGQGATEAVSLGIMASQATANAAMQQIEAGATPQEAFQRAVIAGAIEVITEKFSVDAFINLRNSRSAKAFLTNALKSMGTEGTEEMASDVLNLVADRMTGYEKSDENNAIMNYMQQGMSYEEAKKQFGKDFLLQCFEDGLAGALSAGFGSGHAFVQGRFMGMRSAEQDIKSGSAEINAESASVLANKFNNENLRKAAESVQKKKTAANVDSMNIAIEDFIEEEIASASTLEELDQKVREIKNTEGVSTEIKSIAEYGRMERVQQLNEEAGSYHSAAVTEANLLSTEEAKDILDDPVRTAQIENTDVYKASMNDAKLASMPEADAVEIIKNVVANSETPGLARNLRSRAGQDLKPGGMTAMTDDGEQVGIAGYVGQQNGMPLVRTTSGRILPANMLNFDNTDFVTVVNQAAANNRQLRTEDMAEAYVDAYAQYAASDANDGGLDATQYRNAMIRPGAEGSESFVQLVNNGVAFSDIVDMIQNNEGSVNLALLKDRISIDSLRNIYNQVSQYNKERSIRAKTRGAKYTNEQQRTFVKMLSEATGREVVFASPEDMPQLIGSNGYITNDGKIYISVYADQPAVITMTHELVHSIEGTEAYQQLRDFIMEHLKDNERFQEQYERRKAQYERHTGREMSQEEIEREMIAYSTELVFRDVSSVDALVKHNRGLAGKLADFIGRFSKRLGKSIRDYEMQYGVSEESRMMGTDKATLAEFRTRLLDALEKGSEEIRERGLFERDHGSFSAKEYEAAYDQEMRDFLDKSIELYRAKDKELDKKRYTIELKINPKLAKAISELVGWDVSNYKIQIQGNAVGHIYKRHGDNDLTKGKHDRSLGNLDPLASIDYFLNNFDEVFLTNRKTASVNNKDGSSALLVDIIKNIDGKHYLIAQIVPDTNETIFIHDMFMQKNEEAFSKHVASVKEKSPSPNGRTGHASENASLDNKIASEAVNSKQKASNNGQNSLSRDSDGRELSDQQRNFFKDSKVVDENGNLLVMYHGTPRGGFTVFKNDLQFFTENKDYADKYQSPSATSRTAGKEATNPQTYEVYLNITNPFDIRDPETRERFIDEYVKGGYALGIDPYVEYQDTTSTGLPSWEEADNIYEWMEDNDLLDEYDGIIVDEGSYPDENGNPISRGISYVTFSPEQIKNVDNKAPTENEDIRFSLQRPIEETRDLVAVHNINQDKFLKSASLGGFAMPSIAIVKAQAGHNKFGDISFVFDKNTIDPSKKKNKVYGGDAWTPLFPTIDRKLNFNVFNDIRQYLDKYENVLDEDDVRQIRMVLSNYDYNESTTDSADDIVDMASTYNGFKQLYLAAHNKDTIKLDNYVKEIRTEIGDDAKWISEHIPDIKEFFANRLENKNQYFETIRKTLSTFYQERFGFTEEEAQNVLNNTKNLSLNSIVRDAVKYAEGIKYNSKTETDYDGFYKELNDAVDRDDFRKWLQGLFENVIEKEGIYNGRDPFTPLGNRRDFDALHYEVNLENIVRAMLLQDDKGGGGLFGGNILAVAARNYKNINEIKADEKRLGKISDKDFEALRNEYTSRFSNIVSRLIDKNDYNTGIDFSTKAGVILDALRDFPDSKMGVYKEMKKYIPKTTMEVVDQILDLCRDIAEMPTTYFEAKPQRVVTFDEVKAALVPSNVSTEVITALQDFNVPIVEYEAENDEDRTEKLNNIESYIGQENVKFSLNKEDEEAAADVITDVNDPDYYTYENMIKLPAMEIDVSGLVEYDYEDDTDIKNIARQNIGIYNEANNRSDLGDLYLINNRIGKTSFGMRHLKHSVTREQAEKNAQIVMNLPVYFKNAIVINRFGPKDSLVKKPKFDWKNWRDGKILLGAVYNKETQDLEFVRITVMTGVRTKENEVIEIDHLKAVDKKGTHSWVIAHIESQDEEIESPAEIKISDLFEYVKNAEYSENDHPFYNDFPKDFFENHWGEERGKSDIEKLRYSLNNDGIDDFWFTEMDDMTQEQETALSEAGSILDEGFKVMNEQGIHGIDEKEAKKLAQNLVEKYGSNYSVTALADNIQMVFAYAEGHDMTNYEDLVRIMHEVAMPVINEAADMDPSEKETYDTFRKGIRTKGIRLTDKQKQEVRSVFGSVSEYRNRLMQHGILLKNDGIVLDGLVWAELVEESGYRLSDDVPDVDAPMELLEALDMMTPTIRNPYGMNNSEVAFDAALTIYTDYFENKNVKIRNQLRESLEKMREAQAAAFQDQLKQERIRMANEARITENRLRAQIQELQDAAGQVGVDEAEKDYYVNEINRLEKKIKENNRRTEEKVSDAVMVERARQRVSRYRASERRRKTELKKQITSIAMDLNQRLARPKGQRFVPESMVRAAIEVAEAVNLDTGANKGFMTKLHQLQAAYEHLKTDPNFQYDFDERTAGNIRRLSQIFEGVSIADLDLKQLAEVKQILKEVQHQIIATNQIIREEGNIELREEAEKIHEEMAKVKGIGTKKITNTITDFTINSLNPRRFFRYISGYQKDEHLIKIGGEINHIVEDGFGELNRGQRKKMVVDQEVNQIFDHVLSQPKDLSDFSSNKIKNWIDTGLKRKDGSPVLITKGMRVSLAMHAMNEDSLRHIIYGGINVPNAKLFRSGNLSEAYNRSEVIQLVNTDHLKAAMRAGDQDTVDKIYNEGKKIIKSITDQMTDYEKQWLDASKAYFHDYSGRVINDTSLELKGYKIATMRNYFPIAVDKNFLDTNFDLILDMTVAGQGFTKERVKSFKPIYLEDVMNVVSRSKENIGNYVGFATAVRNFQKLYNYGVNGKTWKSLLNDKWGGTVVNYIENMLKDVQGARKTETTIFDKIRGNYAQAVLTLNPSVTIKQAASYPTAAATLGWKPIVKALGYVERLEKKNAVVLGRAELDLIAKYTPYLDYRSTGRAMQETADMKEAMTRSGPLSFHDLKIRHPKATKGITGWIEGMDKITVGRLWYASQYYIDQQKLPNVKKGSDAYYKRVAKVFELMVEDTQPNYTVMQRTGFSRNPNALLKQMLMFKTQTFQNLGIKFDATMNFAAAERAYRQAKKTGQDLERAKAEKKEAASDLFKAYTSQIAQALVFSAMTFAAQVFLAKPKDYRDDDDEITFASVWDRIWKDALKTLGTEIPFSNYLYEMMMSTIGGEKWYDASIPVTDFINDMQNNAQTITKALEEDDYEALVKAIGNETIDLCTYMGIPADNTIKFVRGIYSRCQDISNDGKLNFNSDYELSQIYHDSSSKSGQYASLYKAIGDKNFEKKYQDAVEKEIKNLQEQEKYQNTSEEDLREQAEKNIKNGLFKEIKENDENYQAMIEAVRTGNSSEYKKALDALLSDKSLQSLFADYDWKKSIKSSLKSDLKEDIRIEDAANARINGNIDEYKRIVNEMKKEDYDQDLLVETINSVITSKTTSSGGGSSSEEKAVGLFTTKDLQFTLDHGDVDDAEEVIEDLISTKMANGKDAEEALDSTKSSVKNQMKDAYYAAGTIEEKERITDKLLKLTYDGNKIFTNKDFNSWYEDDEELQGLITNPIYRSYARGDMATHNSLINEEFKELVAQGKDAKEITRALRTDVTSSNHWKQKYKEAYDRGDTATMAQIESYIYSVTVNGQRLYDDGYCYKYWRK